MTYELDLMFVAEKNRLKEKLEEAAADEHTPAATPSVTNKPDF